MDKTARQLRDPLALLKSRPGCLAAQHPINLLDPISSAYSNQEANHCCTAQLT